MIKVYGVILSKTEEGYFVTIPDFNINTQGRDLGHAIYMARDAIGLMGIDMEDDGVPLPESNSVHVPVSRNDIVTLVDVDFSEYRKRVDNKAIKKNCTIPYWLNVLAEREGVNFSRVLQEALMKKYVVETKLTEKR